MSGLLLLTFGLLGQWLFGVAVAHLVPGAGHWVQQEQPARTVELLKELLAREA